MASNYLNKAFAKAHYELLPEDGGFYAEIVGLDGVWANGPTLEHCRDELAEVLEEWILVRVAGRLTLPSIDGACLQVRQVA